MKFLLALALFLSSCKTEIKSGKPESRIVVIKDKYKNGREVKRKLVYKRVKLKEHKVDSIPPFPDSLKLIEKEL